MTRAVGQTVWSGRLHPEWSLGQSLAVRTMQGLLSGLVEAPVAVHRGALDVPGPRAPSGVAVTDEVGPNGRPMRVFRPPNADETDRVLHFHGGGYVVGQPGRESDFLGQLALDVGCPVVALGYRLAPEHSAGEALDDAVAGVLGVVASGVSPDRIALWGDSAGGGLVLRLLMCLRDEGGPRFAGAVLGSPWVEMASDADSFRANAQWDYLPPELVELWASWTHPEPSSAEVSPIRGDLSALPPLVFLAGELECFRDDIRRCVAQVHEQGGQAELLEGALGVHCWYLTSLLPGDPSVGPKVNRRILGWLEAGAESVP